MRRRSVAPTALQDLLNLGIRDLVEVRVPFSYGEERFRRGQADTLVGFFSEPAAGLG